MVSASESLQAKTIEFRSDIADAMSCIDYARERGVWLSETIEIWNNVNIILLSIATKNGHRLKETDKSVLAREIVSKLPE